MCLFSPTTTVPHWPCGRSNPVLRLRGGRFGSLTQHALEWKRGLSVQSCSRVEAGYGYRARVSASPFTLALPAMCPMRWMCGRPGTLPVLISSSLCLFFDGYGTAQAPDGIVCATCHHHYCTRPAAVALHGAELTVPSWTTPLTYALAVTVTSSILV